MGEKPMSKESGAASILSMILVVVMSSLAVTMIFVVLSPYFGQQLHAPINPVSCLIINSPEESYGAAKSLSQLTTLQPSVPGVPPSVTQCYKADEVLALNKALNMSDAIAMLGVLLTVFAFIGPLFTYLTLTKEKHALEESMKKLSALREELTESIFKSTGQLPKILYAVEVFKTFYRIDAPRGMDRSLIDSDDITLRLLSLLDRDTSAKEVFNHITSYLTDKAIIEKAKHIQMLKKVIRQLYESTYLSAEERNAALRAFLQETLKTTEADFLKETAVG